MFRSGAEQDRDLGALLARAARAFNADVHRQLVALGYADVRVGHGAVFARIDADGRTVTELARRAGMTKQAMGELVEDLETKGYLRRVADPRDARARLVRLTAKGERHVRDAEGVVAEVEGDVVRRLGLARTGELRESLRRLAEDDASADGRPRGPAFRR